MNSVEVHGLIGHGRIDAETAGIRTAQAAKHGNDFDRGCPLERGFDKRPALTHARECFRLLPGCDAHANRSMLGAIPQDVVECLPIGKAQNVIEEPQRIFRVATGMRPPNRGDGPLRSKQVTQGVRRMSRLCERTDEDQIDVGW